MTNEDLNFSRPMLIRFFMCQNPFTNLKPWFKFVKLSTKKTLEFDAL